ncbi:unnamed protein product, partial [marine sediment metagenome]
MCECLQDIINFPACSAGGGEIIHASQDEAGSDFGPAVTQNLETSIFDQADPPVVGAVGLVVARNCPNTERCGEA